MKFPTCPVFQNLVFPTHFQQRIQAKCHTNEGNVQGIQPYPADFMHVGNLIFGPVLGISKWQRPGFGFDKSFVTLDMINIVSGTLSNLVYTLGVIISPRAQQRYWKSVLSLNVCNVSRGVFQCATMMVPWWSMLLSILRLHNNIIIMARERA